MLLRDGWMDRVWHWLSTCLNCSPNWILLGTSELVPLSLLPLFLRKLWSQRLVKVEVPFLVSMISHGRIPGGLFFLVL